MRLGFFRIERFAVWLLLSAAASVCQADALSLPLQGYFHPGRAIPIQWDLDSTFGANTALELSADGAVTTRVPDVHSSHGIFPWLIEDRNVSNIRGATFSLHSLEDSDRLVATTIDDPSLAGELFPSSHVIAIHFDPSRRIEGSPMAWESLDGLLLTPGQLTQISPEMRRGLLAAGIILAVTGEAPPDENFPWRKAGRLWIASNGLSLPPAVNDEALTPALGWIGGRSLVFRRQIVLFSILFCILIGGIGLWKSRWMPLALLFFCIAFSGLMAWEDGRQSSVAEGVGTVRIPDLPLPMKDVWLFQQSHRDAAFNVAITGLIEPIVADSRQWGAGDLILICDSSGSPIVLKGKLKADQPLAILSRQAGDKLIDQSFVTSVTSPLKSLVTDSIYPGRSVIGQINNTDNDGADLPTHWPTIILR